MSVYRTIGPLVCIIFYSVCTTPCLFMNSISICKNIYFPCYIMQKSSSYKLGQHKNVGVDLKFKHTTWFYHSGIHVYLKNKNDSQCSP